MDLDVKKIINLHKIDTRLHEINDEKGGLPEIIDEQKEIPANENELKEKSLEFSIEEKLLEKDKKKVMSEIADSLFLDKYKEDNESVVASVYNGSCGSCFYSLPAQSLQDAKKGKLITCPNCSIYLYFDEDNQ